MLVPLLEIIFLRYFGHGDPTFDEFLFFRLHVQGVASSPLHLGNQLIFSLQVESLLTFQERQSPYVFVGRLPSEY